MCFNKLEHWSQVSGEYTKWLVTYTNIYRGYTGRHDGMGEVESDRPAQAHQAPSQHGRPRGRCRVPGGVCGLVRVVYLFTRRASLRSFSNL